MEINLNRKSGKFNFEATNASGFTVELDANPVIGGEGKGFRPMETLLVGLGGCSGIDMVNILAVSYTHLDVYKRQDHRRVYILMVFFKRKGIEKAMTKNAEDYKTGDIVCWILPKNLTHIGVVTKQKSADGKRYLIVHNIGAGQVMEDILFDWKIIGHYTCLLYTSRCV